jgi:hypothetical protein
MTWKAKHPDNTEDVRVPEDGPTFTIGFWPPLLADKVKRNAREWMKQGDAPISDEEGERRFLLTRDMVRFGVRGWKGLEPAAAFESIEYGGRRHSALTEASIDLLYANKLFDAVALAAWGVNSLSEDAKKKSDSPSPSQPSTLHTAAPSASPATPEGAPTK